MAGTDQLYMRLYTPTVNSEWLPGYKLVISCPGVLQSALYFCCSTPGQDIINTYMYAFMYCIYVLYVCTYVHMHVCTYVYLRTYVYVAMLVNNLYMI